MTDWGRNSFWQDLVDRLERQEASTNFRQMDYSPTENGWVQQHVDGMSCQPAFLQGRRLVVDVTDETVTLYPLGLAGRFKLRLGFALTNGGNTLADVDEMVFGLGSATLVGLGWRVTVAVSTTLPILELSLTGATETAVEIQWPGESAPIPLIEVSFRLLPSFEQDVVVERNNSTAPDPLPLAGLPIAGVTVRHKSGRIVVAVAGSAAETEAALAQWELVRTSQLTYWADTVNSVAISVPSEPITRQARYSVHNSLFSRSVDEDGRDIFIHGRRDRGYADSSHLHQSYQMHLAALAAGEDASVRQEILSYCALQRPDGWIELAPRPVRGTSRYVGRYTGAHLLLAAERYYAWSGDAGLFDERVVSKVDPEFRSVADRIDLAVEDLLAHTYRGLIEPCGWADAWNPEVLAQGQISAATVLGLRAWAEVCEALGRLSRADSLRASADAIADSMLRELYDPKTGIIAEHLFPGKTEGGTLDDYWAHTQVWVALADVVEDGRALDLVKRECLHNGIAIAPESAFEKEYIAASTDSTDSLPVESTATWLLARWPEVTHLYALAELKRQDPDTALSAIAGQLPQSLHELNPVCAPFYYAEKYLYPGTRPWLCTWAGDPSLIEVVLSGFLGVRPSARGLQIHPQLPTEWRGNQSEARFFWRREQYRIEFTPNIASGTFEIDGTSYSFGHTLTEADIVKSSPRIIRASSL